MNTKPKPDIPTCRVKMPGGRCYDMAQRAIIRLPKNTRWRYAEGFVNESCGHAHGEPHERVIGHGWLADGIEVFDTTFGNARTASGCRRPNT